MPPVQQPIGSHFGAASTAKEIMKGHDLSAKVAIVTGGSSGIGLETSRVLRLAGAQVIVPARDLKKAEKALKGLDVEIEPMELMDPASIDAFAEKFLASGRSLHILVNSAGIMANPLTRDARGYESQFSTNHLGHFQLTTRLWAALVKAKGSRVISVSSWGHRHSPVVFEDPNFERREYTPWLGYGQSKTANVLFALGVDERGKSENIRAFSVHPGGIVATGLGKYITAEQLRTAGVIDEKGNPILDPSRGLKTVEQGAATSIWCAASPQLNGLGGVYCADCEIATVVPPADDKTDGAAKKFASTPMGVMPYAVDSEAAERLWALSECLVFG